MALRAACSGIKIQDYTHHLPLYSLPHLVRLQATLLSVTIVVSDEELEVQIEREGLKAEHGSGDDLEWDHVDSHANSGPSRREVLRARVKRGSCCEALVD